VIASRQSCPLTFISLRFKWVLDLSLKGNSNEKYGLLITEYT